MSDYYCELCNGKIPAVGFVYRESASRDIPVCTEHMKEAFDPAGDAEKRGYLRGLAEAEDIARKYVTPKDETRSIAGMGINAACLSVIADITERRKAAE